MVNSYQYVEDLLVRTLTNLASVFTESEVAEVREFIDVGEYGLALETMVDIIVEESKQIPIEVLLSIRELVVAMELSEDAFEDKLSGNIKKGIGDK